MALLQENINIQKIGVSEFKDAVASIPASQSFYANDLLNSSQITKNIKYERNPSVYKDTNGILWLWYVRCRTLNSRTEGDVDGAYYDIYYQTSEDGGVTWNSPIQFVETLPATFSSREISWMQDNTGLYHLFISNGCSGSPSTDRLMHHFIWNSVSQIWTNMNPIVITGWASNPAQIGHAHVVYANSTFYMAFQQRSSNSVYCAKSSNGNTWTYVTVHAVTYLIPKILYVSPTELYIVSTSGSNINLAKSIDNGVTFTNANVITYSGSWDPMISKLPSGNLIIVWAPNVGSDGQQLMVSESVNGVTWSLPIRTLTDGKKFTYEWWDYWPFIYSDGVGTYIYYASERNMAEKNYLSSKIWILKYDLISYWKDLIISSFALGQGASAPDTINYLAAGGLKILGFDGSVTLEQLYGSHEMQHDYKEGSNIYFHVHWCATTANAGNVKWQLEYSWVNQNETAPVSTTISIIQAAGGTAWVHKLAEFPVISGQSKKIGSVIEFRIYRDPNDAADTYPNDAALKNIGIHYQDDLPGSRSRTAK